MRFSRLVSSFWLLAFSVVAFAAPPKPVSVAFQAFEKYFMKNHLNSDKAKIDELYQVVEKEVIAVLKDEKVANEDKQDALRSAVLALNMSAHVNPEKYEPKLNDLVSQIVAGYPQTSIAEFAQMIQLGRNIDGLAPEDAKDPTRVAALKERLKQFARDYPEAEAFSQLSALLVQRTAFADKEKGKRLVEEFLALVKGQETREEPLRFVLAQVDRLGTLAKLSEKAIDQSTVTLGAGNLKGKVVLLDAWGVFCAPCLKMTEDLKVLQEKYGPQGFEVVGINFDNSKKVLEDYLKKKEVPWPQIFKGSDDDRDKFMGEFLIEGFPALIFVDRKGNFASIALNEIKTVEAVLVDLLKMAP